MIFSTQMQLAEDILGSLNPIILLIHSFIIVFTSFVTASGLDSKYSLTPGSFSTLAIQAARLSC